MGNILEVKTLLPFKVGGVKNSKEKTIEHYKAGPRTPKDFFVYCSIAIKVQDYL
jgi:hypothetical protein